MASKRQCLICAAFVWLLGFIGLSSARAAPAADADPLSVLPVRLYTPAGQKPLLLFSTPCMELAKLDQGIGPLAGMRELMALTVLEGSKLLPVDLQPVCK